MKKNSILAFIVSMILYFWGIELVAPSDLTVGYAVYGTTMLFVSGIIFGYSYNISKSHRRPSRKRLKEESKKNLGTLFAEAKKVSKNKGD